MKVLQLVDSLAVGGAERMAVNLCNALYLSGTPVCLCSTREGGGLQGQLNDEIEFRTLNKKSSIDFNAFWRFCRFVKNHKVTTIHAHSSSLFWAVGVKVLINNDLNIVWHNHNGNAANAPKKYIRVLRWALGHVRVAVNVNEELNHWVRGVRPNLESIYIQNFPLLDDWELAGSLAGQAGTRVVMLANLREPKGHIYALEAFKGVVEEFPEATLHLIGKVGSDSYAVNVLKFIETNGLTDSVYVHGTRNDIGGVLKNSDVGLMTSIWEGLPMALLEYGLAGLPVLCTNVGKCKDVIQDGKYGVFVDSRDATSIKEELIKLLIHRSDSIELGRSFRKHVLTSYSKEAVVNELLCYYS